MVDPKACSSPTRLLPLFVPPWTSKRSSTSRPTPATRRSPTACVPSDLAKTRHPVRPMCRWRRDGVVVDVMPVDERILGFSNRWYPAALATARALDLAEHRVRVVTPALFVATKLEAYRGRGRGDFLGSHDLEDIVTVFDGRAELPGGIAESPADVRNYIAAELRALLDNPDFLDALS